MLRERGVFLRSLTEGFDTSTASGRLLYHVLGAVAEFEREVIKERTVAGMKAAKKRDARRSAPGARGFTACRSWLFLPIPSKSSELAYRRGLATVRRLR